jgi:DNA-binding transcriptional LysR family regulator
MKGVDLNRRSIFQDVARAGSLSGAAQKLHQTKSSITRQMQALEEELGVQLIYRTTRQFQLTPAGEELLERASPLLAALAGTLEQLSADAEQVAGKIRVTVPDDIGVELMGGWCHEFLTAYPRVKLEVHSGNQVVDLVRDSYDLGVRIGKLRDSTLLHKKIGTMRLTFVMSPTLAQKLGGSPKLGDLAKAPYLAFSGNDSHVRGLTLSNGREERAFTAEPAFIANNFFALRALAAKGAGFTLLPPFLAREPIARGELVPVLKGWETEGTPVQVVMPQQQGLPERLRRFSDFLTAKLSKVL